MMKPDRLVLFDIDGTLLWPDGAGRASLKLALEKVYGTSGAIDSYVFAGYTDHETVRKLMNAAGLAPEVIEEKFPLIPPAMQEALEGLVIKKLHNIKPCPGGPELVQAVARHDRMIPGILTGNVPPTAAIKLRAAGYDLADFKINAYGDISSMRADLVTYAVVQAQERIDVRFEGKQIVILGDTPADILCGKHLGARVIILLTGWTSRADLEALSPDYIFDDMTSTETLLEAILA